MLCLRTDRPPTDRKKLKRTRDTSRLPNTMTKNLGRSAYVKGYELALLRSGYGGFEILVQKVFERDFIM